MKLFSQQNHNLRVNKNFFCGNKANLFTQKTFDFSLLLLFLANTVKFLLTSLFIYSETHPNFKSSDAAFEQLFNKV